MKKIKCLFNSLWYYFKHPKELWRAIKPYMTFKMMLTFGLVWILSTGWSYVFIAVGSYYHIPWMSKVGIGAQIFFWNPLINEKLITIPFSIALYKWIFKEDPNVKQLDKV